MKGPRHSTQAIPRHESEQDISRVSTSHHLHAQEPDHRRERDAFLRRSSARSGGKNISYSILLQRKLFTALI